MIGAHQFLHHHTTVLVLLKVQVERVHLLGGIVGDVVLLCDAPHLQSALSQYHQLDQEYVENV